MSGKTILAIVLGALIGFLLAGVMGWFGNYVFPPSVLVDMNPQLARTMAPPMPAMVIQLIGWGGGTVLGGMLALRFAEEPQPWLAWAVAGTMTLTCIALAFVSPHPIWFVILCLIVILGAGFLAGQLLGHGEGFRFAPEPQHYAPEPHYEPEPAHYEPEPQSYEPAPYSAPDIEEDPEE
jgi:hypothetical protein